ncbi:peptidoglycan-binding protein [Amycolatopsis sp. NPDC051061]|uniref:HlyD family efflux transporter periplasmic adaptor subunit n=1 Tax=Amycolatopsis sp. NPDC051061 TaxID=3155042 RepID=UPI0034456F41
MTVAVAAGAAGWLIGTQVQSPAAAAAAHQAPAPSLITAPVVSRVLTSTVTAQGTVTYDRSIQLTLAGTVGSQAGAGGQIITKVPAAGTVLKAGDVLLEISGRPVFVLQGLVPMYRALTSQDKGDDVKQLQVGLTALGYGKLHSGVFDSATMNAVKKWYSHAGYDVPQAPATPSGASSEGGAKPSENADGVAGGTPGPSVTTETAPSVPSGEIIFLPKLPARLDTVTAKAGAPSTTPIGTITAPEVIVQGRLPVADASLVHAGMPATLTTNDGTTVAASLQAVGPDAEPSAASGAVTGGAADGDTKEAKPASGAAQAPTAPSGTSTALRLVPKDSAALASYSGQAVKIGIEVGSTGGAVLVVPVAAVSTGADGTSKVVVQRAGGRTESVLVTLGLTTLGLVKVTPAGGGVLAAGDRVVVGSS